MVFTSTRFLWLGAAALTLLSISIVVDADEPPPETAVKGPARKVNSEILNALVGEWTVSVSERGTQTEWAATVRSTLDGTAIVEELKGPEVSILSVYRMRDEGTVVKWQYSTLTADPTEYRGDVSDASAMTLRDHDGERGHVKMTRTTAGFVAEYVVGIHLTTSMKYTRLRAR